GQSFQGLRPAH
ncbi:hypothetical protein BN1723_019436, partial [Verticillium longisporum]